MIDDEDFSEGDDFEKLLNSFINSKVEDDNENSTADDDNSSTEEEETSQEDDYVSEDEEEEEDEDLDEQDIAANEEVSAAFEEELAKTFDEAREAADEEEKMPELKPEESELAQAYINYKSSIDKICKSESVSPLDWDFNIDYLYPNYKPSIGHLLVGDLIAGWNLLCSIFPDDVGKFNVSSSDEEFLNFAETLRNQDLQLAVISYVEILIDMESCELSYQAKLLKYQEKYVKRLLYEEYLERKERQKRFTEVVEKKDFPIDAERLISNYFRVAQKDVDGAYKALTTNPAIFAPIDFAKIKPRFFGLVKVTPKDGIRINIEIGKFMKKVKV